MRNGYIKNVEIRIKKFSIEGAKQRLTIPNAVWNSGIPKSESTKANPNGVPSPTNFTL